MHPPGSRLRRYLLIFGLLGIAAAFVGGWFVFRQRFPNFFDREQIDAAEVNKLAAVDLSQTQERIAEAKDWPQFRGPLRDGWSPGTDFRTNWNEAPPTVQWSKPCGGGYSSIAVAEGKLYTMDRDGANERIRCLNAADGTDLWTHEYPADYGSLKMGYAAGPRATPTIHKNMLYAVGAAGRMTALKLPATPGGKTDGRLAARPRRRIRSHTADLGRRLFAPRRRRSRRCATGWQSRLHRRLRPHHRRTALDLRNRPQRLQFPHRGDTRRRSADRRHYGPVGPRHQPEHRGIALEAFVRNPA